MTQTVLDGLIEIEPGVLDGKPCVAGSDVAVQEVARQHVLMGRSREGIAAEYDITFAQIYAALTYYYDHREEIDETLRAEGLYLRALKFRYDRHAERDARPRSGE
jgi:uncharacterized protein (DUF433 family)